MSSLHCLNAFICERLTAAAEEIFGAVEKTLIDYQEEINRTKQEIEQLRTLSLCPEVRLHRLAADQFSPPRCDKEVSTEEECAPDVGLGHTGTLHIKEEDDQGAHWPGLSGTQQRDATASPQFVNGEGHKEPPSKLYRILIVEETADIKTKPDGDDLLKSASTQAAQIPCGLKSKSSGPQRETLIDLIDIPDEKDEPDEQQDAEQNWNPCQDHRDPDPPQMKVQTSRCLERRDNCELPLQPERSVYDEHHSLSPKHNQILTNQTFYTAEKKRRDAEGDGGQLSGPTRVSPPIYSVSQREYGENTEGVMNGAGMRPKRGQNSTLFSDRSDNIAVEGRRHSCPVCGKRFKESSHLKDHVRIHTGEKPFRCEQCGMNFRQSGALSLHMRIHTGERRFQCTECGRRFTRKGDMEMHRVTHKAERPHVCIVCGKGFKRKSILNTHLKIHAEVDYTQPL